MHLDVSLLEHHVYVCPARRRPADSGATARSAAARSAAAHSVAARLAPLRVVATAIAALAAVLALVLAALAALGRSGRAPGNDNHTLLHGAAVDAPLPHLTSSIHALQGLHSPACAGLAYFCESEGSRLGLCSSACAPASAPPVA